MKPLDINKNNRFLGYYYGVGSVQGVYPEGLPGWFFINGETNSVWMWDVIGGRWIDTNRIDGGLKGYVTDAAHFEPEIFSGIKASYLHVACYPGTITFTKFKNSGVAVTVTVAESSVIMLFWNGDYWEHNVIPMKAPFPKGLQTGVWSLDNISLTLNEEERSVTVGAGWVILSYGNLSYKYLGFGGTTVNEEYNGSTSGLSALLFDIKNDVFRFLHFSKYAEITNDMVLIALFHGDDISFTNTPLTVNGKHFNTLTSLRKGMQLGIWGNGDVSVELNGKVPQFTAKAGGSQYLFYDNLKYKYMTFPGQENVPAEYDGDTYPLGLSALLFDTSTDRFRFLNFTKFSEISENMVLIATFSSGGVIYSSSVIKVNGELYSPLVKKSGGESEDIRVGMGLELGMWGGGDIKISIASEKATAVIDACTGILYYGNLSYRYFSYPGQNITCEKDDGYSSYSGLSALVFDTESDCFRFLHFTKFSEITTKMVLIATLKQDRLFSSTSPVYFNGVYYNPLSSGNENRYLASLVLLGDSITTEGYYASKLRTLLGVSDYRNYAVSGAWWSDKDGTAYDGNPLFGGPDGNVNNVLGNQVDKFLKEFEDAPFSPEVIVISAGTNDADSLVPESVDWNYIEGFFTEGAREIPLSEPTFDATDTYCRYRKSMVGAIRHCVTILKERFPYAKIYLCTPIEGAPGMKIPENIAKKQKLISYTADRLGIGCIHVGEECGIIGANEVSGKNGVDLADGLHPNVNGSWKMANYIADMLKLKANKANLSPVCYSGSYDDIKGKPQISGRKTLHLNTELPEDTNELYSIDLAEYDDIIIDVEDLHWSISALPISSSDFVKEVNIYGSLSRSQNTGSSIVVGSNTYTVNSNFSAISGISSSFSDSSIKLQAAIDKHPFHSNIYIANNNVKYWKLYIYYKASAKTYNLTFIPIS